MTEDEEKHMKFVCPGCGTENFIRGNPEDFEGKVFECEGCGVNVLLDNYKGGD